LGKVILQVSIAVFLGAVDKFFGQRWLSPLEKIGPYAYEPEVFLVKNVMFGNNFVIFLWNFSGLDNHWICKPFNLARGLDTLISKDLSCLLRLSESGPKVGMNLCSLVHNFFLLFKYIS